MKAFLLNAFSLQMVDVLPEDLTSAIGHQDTANVLGVQRNRINVRINKGDIACVAQLQGGRLPESSSEDRKGFYCLT